LPCGHVQTVINPEAKRLYNYFSGQKQWACISRIGDRYEYWYEYTYLPEQEHEHSVMELERLRHEYASTTGDTSDYAFSHWYGEIILCLAHLQMEEEERAEREKDPCDDCYNWDFCEYCKDGGNMEWN
jgi:hypothetical protein